MITQASSRSLEDIDEISRVFDTILHLLHSEHLPVVFNDYLFHLHAISFILFICLLYPLLVLLCFYGLYCFIVVLPRFWFVPHVFS